MDALARKQHSKLYIMLGINEISLREEVFVERYAALIDRPALHSFELWFTHPISGKDLHFTAALPEDMARLLRKIGADPLQADAAPH